MLPSRFMSFPRSPNCPFRKTPCSAALNKEKLLATVNEVYYIISKEVKTILRDEEVVS
jgi:hypothetical protein